MVNSGDKSSDETAANAPTNASTVGEDDSKQALLKVEINGVDGEGADDSLPLGQGPGDIELAEVARIPDVQVVGGAGVNGDVEACEASVTKKPPASPSSSGGQRRPSNASAEKAKSGTAGVFSGLTKEELEKFAKDPFWRRLRLTLFVLFWVVWVAMFAAVILIIVLSPKCPPRQTRQFWQRPIYRVQVRSFAPDPAAPGGPGNLAGFESRLSYLRDTLGLNNFLLDSLVKVAPASGCPDNFAAPADPSQLDRLRSLTKLGRKKGFQLLMELDLSQADPGWLPGSGDGFVRDPTNFDRMLSRDGRPAWSGGLLHMPRSSCASINVSNERIQQVLFEALSVWLDSGLSGFLLTNLAFMMPKKTNQVSEFPINYTAPSDWHRRDPRNFLFTDAAAVFLRAVRSFLDAEAARRGRELALLADFGDLGGFAAPPDRVAVFAAPGGPHAIVDTGLGGPLGVPAGLGSGPFSLRSAAETVLKAAQPNAAAIAWATNWPRLRRDPSPALAVLGLTLPGVSALYYGQELGMGQAYGFKLDPPASYLSGNDSTDSAQPPMQWAGEPANAGWLPGADQVLNWTVGLELRAADIRANNLRRLSASGHPESSLQLTQQLIRLAGRLESLQWGQAAFVDTPSPELVAFTRKADRFPGVLVLVNTGARPLTIDAPEVIGAAGKLELMHSWGGGGAGSYAVGSRYKFGGIFVPQRTALVFVADE